MARLETWLLVYLWKRYLEASEKAVYAGDRFITGVGAMQKAPKHQMLRAEKRQKHFHHHSKDSGYSWDQKELTSWWVQVVSTYLQSDREKSVLACWNVVFHYKITIVICLELQKISLQKPYVGFLASRTRSFKESLEKRTTWLFFFSERHQEFHAWMHGRAPLEAKEALQPQTDRLNSVGSRPGGGCATQGLWKLQHLHLSWD